jgi:hypothetical protein
MSDQMNVKSESAPEPYEVGYGKPPRETRFQKGKSGNPKGRPKKEKAKEEENLGACLRDVLNEEIEVREGDRMCRMSIRRAILRNLARLAATGNIAAVNAMAKILSNPRLIESDNSANCGVLLIPPDVDFETWTRLVDEHQAPFRGNHGMEAYLKAVSGS